MYFIVHLLVVVAALVAVAFFTLLERKVLGFVQIRKGPNKIGLWGVLTPFGDAVKLFTKGLLVPKSANLLAFFGAPALSLTLALGLLVIYPSKLSPYASELWVLVFFCLSSLSVYSVLLSGWSSNSIYAFLGGVRSAAQSVSYEVCMFLLFLFSLILYRSLGPSFSGPPSSLVFLPVAMMWMLALLAETNRAPFDFAEGESELVSGFNVEFSSSLFALLFLGEYAAILVLSFTSSWFFFSTGSASPLGGFMFALFFLLARGALPRFRYDLLMSLCWKALLPVSISLLAYACIRC